jgi:polyribonucleotide nucleotidyltransferase
MIDLDEVGPRRRLRIWLEREHAANPDLTPEELSARVSEHFRDDDEMVQSFVSQTVGKIVRQELVQRGYRPTGRGGEWARPTDE